VVNIAIISVGCLLLVIAVVGYITPFNMGWTIPGIDAICSGDMGQLGQTLSAEIQQGCSDYKLATLGIYGLGLVGIILIIVGAVISRGQKEAHHEREVEDDAIDILEKRYAKGEITKEEFDKMKEDLE
jgi:putative membrane protein